MIQFFQSLRAIDIAIFVVLLLIGWSFYRAHNNQQFDNFNFFDLIMENGRVSRLACAFLGSWLVTSWIMVRLAIDVKMTEGYLTVYGGMWVAPIIAKLFSGNPPKQEASK